jgi:hypothetical protein
MEELPHQRTESVTVHVYKMGNENGCSNYQGILLLLTTYKMLSNILLSMLSPHVDGINGDHRGHINFWYMLILI